MKEGGHAVDAAIAAAFAVGVVEPWMSGIGGVGAMLVLEAATGKVTAIDFGGRSPKGLKVEDFPLAGGLDEGNLFGWPLVKDNLNTTGAKALVAPTEPAGLALAHKMFGTQVVGLARRACHPACRGRPGRRLAHDAGDRERARRPARRTRAASERFLSGGLPPVPAAPQAGLAQLRLPAPALARTLRAIAEDGAGVLYRGALARAIAEDVQALGGYLTEEDLAAVAPREREPLRFSYRDRTLHVLPELNGGPTLAVAFDDLARNGGAPGTGPDGAALRRLRPSAGGGLARTASGAWATPASAACRPRRRIFSVIDRRRQHRRR